MIIAGALLTWCSCAALWRFRESKLGTEVFDLYFIDSTLATGMVIWYVAGGDTALGASISGALMFMRFTRIFAWQGTTTHDTGWGVLGPMGYFQNKKTGPSGNKKAMLLSLGLAITGAVVAAILHRQLAEGTRVALIWACGLGFIITVGPQLLRMVGNLILSATAASEREGVLQARIAQLEKQLEQQGQSDKLPSEVLAAFTTAYNTVREDKRAHMIEVVQCLAANYPAKSTIQK